MKNLNAKGFTLIELMICVAIVAILAAIGIPAFHNYATGGGNSKQPAAQVQEVTYQTQCIDGTKYVITPNGATQIKDSNGNVVECR